MLGFQHVNTYIKVKFSVWYFQWYVSWAVQALHNKQLSWSKTSDQLEPFQNETIFMLNMLSPFMTATPLQGSYSDGHRYPLVVPRIQMACKNTATGS